MAVSHDSGGRSYLCMRRPSLATTANARVLLLLLLRHGRHGHGHVVFVVCGISLERVESEKKREKRSKGLSQAKQDTPRPRGTWHGESKSYSTWQREEKIFHVTRQSRGERDYAAPIDECSMHKKKHDIVDVKSFHQHGTMQS